MKYSKNYYNVHAWLTSNFPKKGKCELCFEMGKKRYEYALKKEKDYEKNRDNFLELCVACHKEYDNIIPKLTELKYKPIYSIKNGVKTFYSSATEASEKLGILRTSIGNTLKGRSAIAGGYQWSYADN